MKRLPPSDHTPLLSEWVDVPDTSPAYYLQLLPKELLAKAVEYRNSSESDWKTLREANLKLRRQQRLSFRWQVASLALFLVAASIGYAWAIAAWPLVDPCPSELRTCSLSIRPEWFYLSVNWNGAPGVCAFPPDAANCSSGEPWVSCFKDGGTAELYWRSDLFSGFDYEYAVTAGCSDSYWRNCSYPAAESRPCYYNGYGCAYQVCQDPPSMGTGEILFIVFGAVFLAGQLVLSAVYLMVSAGRLGT